MMVYLSRDSMLMAAHALAMFRSRAVVERMATYKIKKLAFRVRPETAAVLAFWCGVLHHARTLWLASGESERLKATMPEGTRRDLLKLELYSRPQAVPHVVEPVTKVA